MQDHYEPKLSIFFNKIKLIIQLNILKIRYLDPLKKI
jgi:hypothetical protein